MSLPTVPSPRPSDWFHAVHLDERLADHGGTFAIERPTDDPSLGEQRLARWRTTAGEKPLAARLASLGLDDATFFRLLGESAESLRRRLGATPPWIERLETLYRRGLEVAALDAGAPELPWHLTCLAPLVADAEARLSARASRILAASTAAPTDPESWVAILRPDLLRRLSQRVQRTLVVELHAARLEGRLAGDDPASRLASFTTPLATPAGGLALLRSVPLMARQALDAADRWVDTASDLLAHLVADHGELRRRFPELRLARVAKVHGGLSDPHRGGRSVALLDFGGAKLVYKPRSLAVDAWFQELLRWLAEREPDVALRPLRVIDRGDHGWMEHVTHETCRDVDALRRFYRRQGRYLALFHALGASDLHHENVIAAGEHPMPIDHECLVQPQVDDRLAPEIAAYAASVLAVGLLPHSDPVEDGQDISALGAVGGRAERTLFVDGAAETARFERREVTLPSPTSAPVGNAADDPRLAPPAMRDAVVAGFRETYRALLAHRAELLAENGPIDRLLGLPVRVVMRATRNYGRLLAASSHPQLQRDALDLERHLDRLWGTGEPRRELAPVILAEQRALRRGDVPIFTTRLGTRDLWSGDGLHMPGILAEDGLARCRRRLDGLSAADLEAQVHVIAGCFGLGHRDDPQGPRKSWRLVEGRPPARERVLAGVAEVAERLRGRALGVDGRPHWFGARPGAAGGRTFHPLGPDLYAGQTGIALFLAFAGDLLDDTELRTVARATIESVAASPGREESRDLGAFTGHGGVIYALVLVSDLWREPRWLDAAEPSVAAIERHLADDTPLDVVGGTAGALLALLRLHRRRPSSRLVALLRRAGDHLLARSVTAGAGRGWPAGVAEQPPLLGLSHGAGGIAWALAELATAVGDERYLGAAREALAYERESFDARLGNWPDLRIDRETGDGDMCAWCHGAPGVALARLATLPHLPDDETPAAWRDVERGLAKTLGRGVGEAHGLCHGALGNLDVVLEIAGATADHDLAARVRRLAGPIVEEGLSRGWVCGQPGEREGAGLMTGLAGVGWGLLRLAARDRVPSVLRLATRTAAVSEAS